MTKLDWSRSERGREGFDSDLGRAWRVGERAAAGERADGSDSLKLLDTPSIYWAAELGRAFPRGDTQGMAQLFKAACHSARSLYQCGGWTLVRLRVQLVHKRASTRNPFPSACYATFFDFWAMIFARVDHRERTGEVPKHIKDFSTFTAQWYRGLEGLRAIDKARGTTDLISPDGLERWLFSLVDEMDAPNDQT